MSGWSRRRHWTRPQHRPAPASASAYDRSRPSEDLLSVVTSDDLIESGRRAVPGLVHAVHGQRTIGVQHGVVGFMGVRVLKMLGSSVRTCHLDLSDDVTLDLRRQGSPSPAPRPASPARQPPLSRRARRQRARGTPLPPPIHGVWHERNEQTREPRSFADARCGVRRCDGVRIEMSGQRGGIEQAGDPSACSATTVTVASTSAAACRDTSDRPSSVTQRPWLTRRGRRMGVQGSLATVSNTTESSRASRL